MMHFIWITGFQCKFLEYLYPAVVIYERYYPVLEMVEQVDSAVYEILVEYVVHVIGRYHLVYLSFRCRTPFVEASVVLPLLVNYVIYGYLFRVSVYQFGREFIIVSLELDGGCTHHELWNRKPRKIHLQVGILISEYVGKWKITVPLV